MNRSATRWRTITILVGVVVLLMVPFTASAGNPNPGILPLNSSPHGLTYSEWAARWWQWTLQTPASISPVVDTTGVNCDKGQSGRVWFLAGSFTSDPVTRECRVPRGTALFFPLVNTFAGALLTDPPTERTEAYLRSQVTWVEDASFSLVEIDGIAVNNPQQYLEKSAIFKVVLPEDNFFGLPGLTVVDPAVDEGFYLFVPPMKPGEHTIRWQASAGGGGVSQDITYHIEVK